MGKRNNTEHSTMEEMVMSNEYATDYAAALQAKFDAEYAARNPADTKAGKADISDLRYEFSVEKGQKFDRIVQVLVPTNYPQRSVHAFVEKSTGKLIKAAGWKAPAKRSNGELQSQFDLSIQSEFAAALDAADKHGGYLSSARGRRSVD